jgi:hypothetical protein
VHPHSLLVEERKGVVARLAALQQRRSRGGIPRRASRGCKGGSPRVGAFSRQDEAGSGRAWKSSSACSAGCDHLPLEGGERLGGGRAPLLAWRRRQAQGGRQGRGSEMGGREEREVGRGRPVEKIKFFYMWDP